MTVNSFQSHPVVRLLAAAVAIGGGLAGTGTAGAAEPGSCPGGDAQPSAANRQQIEAATSCLVNAKRLARGLAPLRPDPRLDRAARAHNDDMRTGGYFSHTSPSGSTLDDRMRTAGYPDMAGENLLKGTVTPEQAVNLWLASPSHRAILLDPTYRGIGIAQAGEYWTQTAGRAEPPEGRSGAEGSASSGPGSTSSAPGGGGLGQPNALAPEATAGLGGGSGPGDNGAPSSSQAPGPLPARLRVVRAAVHRDRLEGSAEISELANGDAVRVSFTANGRHFSFSEPIEQGRLHFRERLPRSQRADGTGLMWIDFPGNERVQPAEVRLRAARRSARLEPRLLSLGEGVLNARGTISRRAQGVVRLRLSTEGGDRWYARARIANGRWRVQETLPPQFREGGYLTIEFTGYRGARISGAQIARELLAGQSFGGRW